MSDTSIHFKDQGYTSPDFLTNLFKKPLYSSISLASFQTNTQSCRDLHVSSKENQLPTLGFDRKMSSPLQFKHQSNTKVSKSTPVIDEERISSSKYKIFFKTLLHGTVQEEELNDLWGKLEESLKNPFAFDRFIDEIKAKKEKQAQEKKVVEEVVFVEETERIRCKTPQKRQEKISSNTVSRASKQQENPKSMRESIRKNVLDIRQLLLLGQRSIRQK